MGSASKRASDSAVARVIVRPPFLYPGCLVLGFGLDRLLPLPFTFPEVTAVRWTAGGGLIAVGLAIMAAGIRNFSRAAAPVPPHRPRRRLGTTTKHRRGRHPTYLRKVLLLPRLGLVLASALRP